jgi:diguanylate cyclase (GGDEF)-like protein
MTTRFLSSEGRAPIRLETLTLGLVGIVIGSVLAEFAGSSLTKSRYDAFVEVRADTRDARKLQHAVSEAHIAVTDGVFSKEPMPSLERYYDGLNTVAELGPAIEKADRFLSKIPGREHQETLKSAVNSLMTTWADVIVNVQSGDREKAQSLLHERAANKSYAAVSDSLQRYWQDKAQVASGQSESGEGYHWLTLSLQLFAGLASITGILLIFRMSRREAYARADATRTADASRTQMTQLFQMADMLQSASGHLDANAVLRSTSERLLPGLGGALYVFNNSRDRLDRSTTFGPDEETSYAAETISPTQCWALKRGKPHINKLDPSWLCCDHHDAPGVVVMEIPMTARGELLGLLCVSTHGEGAEARLEQCRKLAVAIADGMSLALSNIALREKLRSQALRDPLTGLYNRRYMEDSLERLVRLAGREKKNLSLLMIDLDHFKKLNDGHGHAMGDAVLRETAGAILGSLRESDVACRYGGEELLVILPDCSIDDAAIKAEAIRARIQELSGHHGTSVSASIGVSSMPAITTQMADLIATADTALYAAKRGGRNQVKLAEPKAKSTMDPEFVRKVAVDAAPANVPLEIVANNVEGERTDADQIVMMLDAAE